MKGSILNYFDSHYAICVLLRDLHQLMLPSELGMLGYVPPPKKMGTNQEMIFLLVSLFVGPRKGYPEDPENTDTNQSLGVPPQVFPWLNKHVAPAIVAELGSEVHELFV